MLRLALAALAAGALGGCASAPPEFRVALSELPNCFESNYEAQERLFTIRDLNDIWADPTKNAPNQQCLLTVGPSAGAAPAAPLAAGRYSVYLANGGGGGAGGTLQSPIRGVPGGGGGGGGAGANGTRVTVHLTEGLYRLTIGAGGPGGRACSPAANSAGGSGWLGSPSNMVRVATGELVAGVAGAEAYARPSVYEHEKLAGKGRPGQGGFGPGQTSGGAGARPESAFDYGEQAKAGAGTREPVHAGTGTREPAPADVGIAFGFVSRDTSQTFGSDGDPPAAARVRDEMQSQKDPPPLRASRDSDRDGGIAARPEPSYVPRVERGADLGVTAFDEEGYGGAPGLTYGGRNHGSGGGGGGATEAGDGGNGGGENLRDKDLPPVRGSLGSGGGGGEGSKSRCDPGARGGHGYIAFRRR